jgi:spore maturation protein CgeB
MCGMKKDNNILIRNGKSFQNPRNVGTHRNIMHEKDANTSNHIEGAFQGIVRKKKILMVSYYKSDNKTRQEEYERCLKINLENPFIDHIYLLIEDENDLYINSSSVASRKIRQVITGIKRPTYRDFFDVAKNQNFECETLFIIANSDIFFDSTLRLVDMIDFDSGKVCFLTRYDKDNNVWKHRNSNYSQDVWIVKNGQFIPNSKYCIGFPGCDNKIAYEYNSIGYNIINPSLSIKAYHLHSERIPPDVSKRYNRPYYPVLFTELGIYKKSILHIGLNPEYQRSLSEALRENCTLFSYIDWRSIYNVGGILELEDTIINKIRENDPDIIFMQIQTEGIISVKFVKEILRYNSDLIIINWSGDVRSPLPRWYIELAKGFPKNIITSFSNIEDVNTIKKMGLNSLYMAMGYENRVYCSEKRVIPCCVSDIVFVGNHYGVSRFPLSKFRLEVVKFLSKKYKNSFYVYGNKKWRSYISESNYKGHVSPCEESYIYKNAKIVICMNHFNREEYTSGRLYRAISAGAFCLVHYYKGIEKEFEIGKNIVVWHDVGELRVLIDYYIDNEQERKDISNSGKNMVTSEYNWNKRIKNLLSQINEIRGKKCTANFSINP